MKIVVCANAKQKEELLSHGTEPATEIIFTEQIEMFSTHENADAFIDLLFEKIPDRIDFLSRLNGIIIINSVAYTLDETNTSFIRINGWNGFLKSSVWEASGDKKKETEIFFSVFHKAVEWLPDVAGFVAPRVISMIINEAFLALEEGVSSVEEINTAMKLGTNYPYGPFEWCDQIGIKNVLDLLKKLSLTHKKYLPASLMMETIGG